VIRLLTDYQGQVLTSSTISTLIGSVCTVILPLQLPFALPGPG
jgi:hypothetical protein